MNDLYNRYISLERLMTDGAPVLFIPEGHWVWKSAFDDPNKWSDFSLFSDSILEIDGKRFLPLIKLRQVLKVIGRSYLNSYIYRFRKHNKIKMIVRIGRASYIPANEESIRRILSFVVSEPTAHRMMLRVSPFLRKSLEQRRYFHAPLDLVRADVPAWTIASFLSAILAYKGYDAPFIRFILSQADYFLLFPCLVLGNDIFVHEAVLRLGEFVRPMRIFCDDIVNAYFSVEKARNKDGKILIFPHSSFPFFRMFNLNLLIADVLHRFNVNPLDFFHECGYNFKDRVF